MFSALFCIRIKYFSLKRGCSATPDLFCCLPVSWQPRSLIANPCRETLSNKHQAGHGLTASSWNPGVHAYLQHNHADLFHALDDGVGSARYGHGALRRVRQHIARYLHLGSCGLEQRQSKERASPPGRRRHLSKTSDSPAMEGTRLSTFCLFFARRAVERVCRLVPRRGNWGLAGHGFACSSQFANTPTLGKLVRSSC